MKLVSKILDRAVDRLYRKSPFTTDAERVALLFDKYSNHEYREAH